MTYFKTQRLIGRSFLDKDQQSVIVILTDPTVKQTYMLPDFPTGEDAVKLFRRLMELSQEGNHYVVAICLEDALIGWINDTEQQGSSIEVGYVILPRYQGQGYMTEALKAAIVDLFDRGYTEVKAGAFEENIASIRVMEKCGMVRQEHHDEIQYCSVRHRCVYYAAKR